MDYGAVSVTADGENLVVEQGDFLSSIWIVPDLDMKRARQVTPGYHSDDGVLGITMTQERKVLYTSSSSGGHNLWSVDQDGGNRRQITFDSVSYGNISVSHDGKYLVLWRLVGNAPGLVRMDMDGSNVRPIGTTTAWSPSSSPVSPWIVYTSFDSSGYSLWKVHPDSLLPVRLSAGSAGDGTISPDGKLVACFDYSKELGIVVMGFEGGGPTKKFALPRTANWEWPLQWTADGRGITFVDNRGDVSNIWMQPLAGGPPQQLTHFTADLIYSFGWSRDGRILACARGKVTSDIVMMSGLR
jgi:Tol biopolymer transport system component